MILRIKQSFSAPGNPLDNAVAESFFATFKKEEAYRRNYTSERSFIDGVANYIEFFNNKRQHETLNYHTSAEFERKFGLWFFDIIVSILVASCKDFSLFRKSSFLCFRHKTRNPVALQRIWVNKKPRFRQNCLKNEVFHYVVNTHFRYHFSATKNNLPNFKKSNISFASFDISIVL